jgi:hypothetical protein
MRASDVSERSVTVVAARSEGRFAGYGCTPHQLALRA